MELTHSTPEPTRSAFCIDLNENPYSSSPDSLTPDALSVVRSFHDNVTPPEGEPAELPPDCSECAACGSLVGEGDGLVCDGCELGFHLGCAEMLAQKEVVFEEWLCGNCVTKAVPCNRWPLGVKTEPKVNRRRRYQLLDINALPSSVGEVTYPKSLHVGNGFGPDASGVVRLSINHKTRKMYLESLREYIHGSFGGVLQEGWNVEVKNSTNKDEPVAIYRAPDGKRFNSMSEVAWYLGFNFTPITGTEGSEGRFYGSESSPTGLVYPKRRKTANLTVTNGIAESEKNVRKDSCENQFSGSQAVNSVGVPVNCIKQTDADPEELNGNTFMEPSDGLPVQYEDFFVLSKGKVNSRPSYHIANQIWPIGYKSCWHDKITGSLFISEVLDGGRSGPAFKVQRFSCSAMPIPVGSTIVYESTQGQTEYQNDEDSFHRTCSDENISLMMMLSSPSPPKEHDILSCLGSTTLDCSNDQTSKQLHLDAGLHYGEFSNIPSDNLTLGDAIGEFSVEESSASSAWTIVAQKVVNACRRVFLQSGTLQFFCKHALDARPSSYWEMSNQKYEQLNRVVKFCCQPELVGIPSVVKDDSALIFSCEKLLKWLDQDRSGLDENFVQSLLQGLKREKKLVETSDCCQWGPKVEYSLMHNCSLPPGMPVISRLPPRLLSDALQVWEFLGRFHGVLELKESFSFEELEKELIRPWADTSDLQKFNGGSISCNGFVLTKVHTLLMRVLVGELQSKVAAIIDPKFDVGESKSKRGRKKDTDCWIAAIRTKITILPLNELTWPELVRRYILSILLLDGRLSSADIPTRESGKVFRCLQGDGGVLCGSLTGVAGMESDALLHAEATRTIFGSLIKEHETLAVDDDDSEHNICERVVEDGNIPEWAKALEPVKKLPTNVGARIRKCIYEALDKGPPEWAKKVLEHSISKEVYKGNASGPTKKAVLSVLAELSTEALQKKPDKEQKRKRLLPIADMVMTQSRIVFRCVAASDSAQNFCNLLGRKFINCSDSDDEGLLGTPAMVSRPLDFRTIDLKLAAGAYGGSHEAFLEDIRELWTNLRIAYKDQPDLVKLVEMLSQSFDLLYEKEVLSQFQKLMEYSKSGCLSAESKKEIDDMLNTSCKIPKAPWEEGVCKVCGIDRDDVSVLLCDKCDAEYHKYCLNPPLARIPKGNWYCPSCVAGKFIDQEASETWSTFLSRKKYQGEFTCAHLDALAQIAALMEEREYWELGVAERSCLLRILCDEFLNSTLLRQHLEQSAETSSEVVQKLRALSTELKTLRSKEQCRGPKTAKMVKSSNTVGDDTEGSLIENDRTIENHIGSDACSLLSENLQGLGLCAPLVTGGTIDSCMDVNYSQSNSLDLNMAMDEILHLKNSIASTESQLLNLSLRREFLGSDSFGRLYWVLADSDICPPAMFARNLETRRSGKIMRLSSKKNSDLRIGTLCGVDAFRTSGSSTTSIPCLRELGNDNADIIWVSYQSDTEIEKLLDCLQDDDPRERELKESILCWEKSRVQGFQESEDPHVSALNTRDGEIFVSSNCLNTMACNLLEVKYGPCIEQETTETLKRQFRKVKGADEKKLYRCECLELIWPSRHHCLFCHKTFLNNVELNRHSYSRCGIAAPAPEKSTDQADISKGKSTMKYEMGHEECRNENHTINTSRSGFSQLTTKLSKLRNDGSVCPFDFETIRSKFVIKESNKELVKGICLTSSNGIPEFLQSTSPYLSDPALRLASSKNTTGTQADELDTNAQLTNCQVKMKNIVGHNGDFPDISFVSAVEHNDEKASLRSCPQISKVRNCCIIPEPSLRPLMGKASSILRQLKINLLDMEAALPDEAVRPSKGKLEWRWAWRAFVKSAKNLYEMVQATITLEDMIKSDYLRNTWWYWSSLSAAARISTLSSLALRIYSLDAAIKYNMTSSVDVLQPSRKQGQLQQSSSESLEKCKMDRKPSKKRKDREN